MTEETVLYLPHIRFLLHPKNMRRVYPQAQVEAMAASIRASLERGGPGILQPLIGVWSEECDGQERRMVVIYAGALRWRGACALGDQAPLVPVIIRGTAEADRLLDMIVENTARFDIDPVSEALHYRDLVESSNMSVNEIARKTGKCLAHIRKRLDILSLPEEVQQLIAEGKLLIGHTQSLLMLADAPMLQVEAARLLARENVDLKMGRRICRELHRKHLGGDGELSSLSLPPAEKASLPDGPAIAPAAARWDGLPDDPPKLVPDAVMDHKGLALLVRATCAACEIGALIGHDVSWEMLEFEAAGECRECIVREVGDACNQCPMVTLLRRVRERLTRGEAI